MQFRHWMGGSRGGRGLQIALLLLGSLLAMAARSGQSAPSTAGAAASARGGSSEQVASPSAEPAKAKTAIDGLWADLQGKRAASEEAPSLWTLVSLPIAAALGAVLAFRPRRRGTPPRSPAVIQTQVLLAVVGAIVMQVVGASLARAFGIVGAASLVRYRAKIDDPKDAGVMLACLSIGLASGVGIYGFASLCTLFTLGVVWALESLEPESEKSFLLKIKAKHSPKLQDAIEEVLRGNGIRYELRSSSPSDLAYSVRLPLTKKTDRLTSALVALGKKDAMAVEWSDKEADKARTDALAVERPDKEADKARTDEMPVERSSQVAAEDAQPRPVDDHDLAVVVREVVGGELDRGADPEQALLLVSPVDARERLAAFIEGARRELLIYGVVTDNAMIRLLEERAHAGVAVRIIGRLEKGHAGLSVEKYPGRRLRVRAIVRDGQAAFVGGQGLRKLELDRRREIGLIVGDPTVVTRIVEVFESDWAQTETVASQAKAQEKKTESKEAKEQEKQDRAEGTDATEQEKAERKGAKEQEKQERAERKEAKEQEKQEKAESKEAKEQEK